MLNWIKGTILRALRKAGYQLSRIEGSQQQGYYPVSPSCQIPHLSTLYERILGRRESGFFIEVGAYDGDSFSNSSCLADRGWAGLLIEPVPEFAERARHRHRRNPKIRIIEKAVGATNTEISIVVAGALSSASPEMISAYGDIAWAKNHVADTQKVNVKQVRLDDLLISEGILPGFDVLIIDTEGFESEVMAGFDLSRWHPNIIIIELADFHPDIEFRQGEDREIGRQITNIGYNVIYKDSINTVFARL